jgi:hypothetical protein
VSSSIVEIEHPNNADLGPSLRTPLYTNSWAILICDTRLIDNVFSDQGASGGPDVDGLETPLWGSAGRLGNANVPPYLLAGTQVSLLQTSKLYLVGNRPVYLKHRLSGRNVVPSITIYCGFVV